MNKQLIVLCYVLALTVQAQRQESACHGSEVTFSKDIQPLLAKHCIGCHGPDEAEGGLRLDVAKRAYAKLESNQRAIVPGNTKASELLLRVSSTDDDLRMPPEVEPLQASQIELLRKWIAAGAQYQTHWSYRPVTNPQLPDVAKQDWVINPIDRFVLAQLEKRDIDPSAEADRSTLMKRLYFDLIGLAPSPQEVDAFVNDESPDAYEKLVDRLLDSQHFGERWGRHWLDSARYADSDGYEKDRPRPNAWRYRDWVIDAVNRDMPFDQFTIEQLAGDILPQPTAMQRLATAFHRQTLTNTEGGTDKEQFRVEATFDRTESTASAWMGLTMTCARCHSHKYDQITQREYYQLFAFFNNANEGNASVPKDERSLAAYRQKKQQHDAQLAQLQAKYDAALRGLSPRVDTWEAEMQKLLKSTSSPLQPQAMKLVNATTAGDAIVKKLPDDVFLVEGSVPDKDKYTLDFEVPDKPLTGIRVDVLAHKSLPKNGPGRAPNGNLVLCQLRVYLSEKEDFEKFSRGELGSAEADFSQAKFAAEGALGDKDKTGWAISPQMGKNHHIVFYTKTPLEFGNNRYLRVVLDQQYGGQHTIGQFKLTALSGFDPLRSLPKDVAAILRVSKPKRNALQNQRITDFVASAESETAELSRQLVTLKKSAPAEPTMSVRVIVPANRKTRVLSRGDFLQPIDDVQSGVLAVISGVHPLEGRNPRQPSDRLDLANWLVDAQHPLTSRVVVNQVWAHLFGEGLVRTLNDFGVRGELPTHPQLLDWLAYRFPRDLKWSRKQLIKAIVSSATYRQSSRHREELKSIDPTNLLLSRQNRLRVEAEIVRDLYLSASGLLSRKTGGPSVFPPLPAGVANLSYANNFKWKTSQGEDRYRRGLYTFFKRTSPHPNLISFDCPDSNTSRLKRDSSNTPLQALVTLNNEVFSEAAQALSRRVITEGGDNDLTRLTYGLRLCIARQPAAEELARFQSLLDVARRYYQEHQAEAAKLVSRHRQESVSVEENAAWVATMRIVMNMDEFITRE